MWKINKLLKKIYKCIRDIFLNLDLRKKLFLVYALIAMLPLILLGYYSYTTIRDELTNQMYINLNNVTNQINTNVEKRLDTYSQMSSVLYLDLPLRNYLLYNYTSLEFLGSYNYINNSFLDIIVSNSGMNSLTVYTENTTLPSDGEYIKHIDGDIKSKTWYKDSLKAQGKVIFTDSYLNDANRYVFNLTRLLNYQSINYPYGVLSMELNEDELYSLMSKEDNDKTLFITNSTGTIISCKDKSLITKNLCDILNSSDFLKNPSASLDVKFNGKKVLMVYKTMHDGWKTVSLVQYNTFLSSTYTISRRMLVMYGINIILAIIMIYLTSMALTKRIKLLSKQIKRIESEDFNIEPLDIGRDEIGKLSNTLVKMSHRIQNMIEEVYKKEILNKQAEMNTLQAQINPHFLYNTLASISSLALKQEDMPVHEMVNLLSKFYRISLNKGKNIITIEEEINLTKYYVAIQETRFKNLLHLYYELDESLFEYVTPKLLLQPFIENSINHAIWNDDLGISIIVKLYEKEDLIYFEIIDNGTGMTEETINNILSSLEDNKGGFGVKNVNNRIKLYFGNDFGVNIYSRMGFGTNIIIKIPKTKTKSNS